MRTPAQLAEESALAFLTSRINYERTLPVYDQRDFRLDRMRDLLARLGNPQQAMRIVHVAGTKGKGSTAAMLAGILSAAGYRTGLYSSPHLDGVEERLAIDGIACPREELVELIGRVQGVVAAMDAQSAGDGEGSTRPTYFEVVTALALLRFALRRVEAAVLEVGMGGRLDSTNVCQPLVSVITSISFDHMQQLGNTLAAIAREKAGIIKPGVPLVSGVVRDEPREVIAAVAAANGARLVQAGRDFDYVYRPPRALDHATAHAGMDFHYRAGESWDLVDLELPLVGRHQAANAAVALATLIELRRHGFCVGEADTRRGLKQVRWPARVEVVRRNPTVVLDAAHNVASAEALARVLEESFASPRRLLIFATTRDKNYQGMLAALLPCFDEVIFTRYWSNPRGLAPEELDAVAAEISTIPRHVTTDPATAWRLATQMATPEHLICVAGSFFIAAEMRAAMNATLSA